MSLYKETLMKHFRNPEFKFENSDANVITDGVNPSCGDDITLYVDIENNKITKISYTGNGCAISMSSADIMCELIANKDNSKDIINNFISMLEGEDSITFSKGLDKLEVFKELKEYPARKGCALLPWKTLLSVL